MLKLSTPRIPTSYRVYAALEPGAKLVRQSSSQSLMDAIKKLAKVANAVAWEIREFHNGHERLVKIEEVRL